MGRRFWFMIIFPICRSGWNGTVTASQIPNFHELGFNAVEAGCVVNDTNVPDCGTVLPGVFGPLVGRFDARDANPPPPAALLAAISTGRFCYRSP